MLNSSLSHLNRISIYFFVITLLTACTHKYDYNHIYEEGAKLPVQSVRLHKVLYPGETLSAISFWYTGRVKNVSLIEEYNGQIKSQNSLPIGSIIKIPEDIMVRKDQMSSVFVEQQKPKIEKIKTKESPVTHNKVIPTPEQLINKNNEIQETPTPESLPTDAATNTPTNLEKKQDELIENLIP